MCNSIFARILITQEKYMTPRAKSFPSAGRRLAAALISYQIGHAGVDRVLKQQSDKKINQWWEKRAQELIREMLDKRIFIPPPPQTPRM
jgi:hypothetical protein